MAASNDAGDHNHHRYEEPERRSSRLAWTLANRGWWRTHLGPSEPICSIANDDGLASSGPRVETPGEFCYVRVPRLGESRSRDR